MTKNPSLVTIHNHGVLLIKHGNSSFLEGRGALLFLKIFLVKHLEQPYQGILNFSPQTSPQRDLPSQPSLTHITFHLIFLVSFLHIYHLTLKGIGDMFVYLLVVCPTSQHLSMIFWVLFTGVFAPYV